MNRIKYISNAGIAIEYNNTRLIIDGLYSDNNHEFSKMPKEAINYLFSEKYENYNNYLLYTHYHSHHFGYSRNMNFLKKFADSSILIPLFGNDPEKGKLYDNFIAKNFYYNMESKISLEANVKIEFFITNHSGDEYKDIVNLCFLITIEDKKILITGDTDFINEDFSFLKNKNITVIIINPLFYLNKVGKVTLENLNAKINIINHIPFEEDDKFGFRNLISKVVKRDNKNILPFYSYGQYLDLEKIK